MLKSMSSNAELLLEDDLRCLLQRHRRNTKTPLIVGAVIAVAVVIAVSVGVASNRRHHNATAEPPHPVDIRLAEANLEFHASPHKLNHSDPRYVDFSNRGGRGDDYGELDKI